MQNRLPPLQSLIAFEATARLGGLSRAAVELSLTQSAISHQIQNLETWVGQPLFRRVGRGVTLTAAGGLFCQTVRNTLKTLREGRERIEPYRNMDSVLLACSADFAAGWLMPRLLLSAGTAAGRMSMLAIETLPPAGAPAASSTLKRACSPSG